MRRDEIDALVGSVAFEAAVAEAREPRELVVGEKRALVYDVSRIPGADKLPRALVVLLENVVRRAESDAEALEGARRVVSAGLFGAAGDEIAFMPSRVLFQDFTGVPVFVDFAAMRDAMAERGGDPSKVNPRIPCTLVIDHSVIADEAGSCAAARANRELEASRNAERFAFLKWAASSFENVRIVPPGEGICHQLNIERFCTVVGTDAMATSELPVACFDTLVGTDSHTTTANGLGVLGWGVGGIEAEAAALGSPISMLVPPVVELRLNGRLAAGVSGMDLALRVAELLRAEGVVGTLVEVTGPGVATLTATQRACVANMTPEYGATTTLFPVDGVVEGYLALTGRDAADIAFAHAYLEAQGLIADGDGASNGLLDDEDSTEGRIYARSIELDLSTVEVSLAGPSRPHNRVVVSGLGERFRSVAKEHGRDLVERFEVELAGETYELGHGAIAIAAITSCTTATDPAMMLAAGITAKKARERGLSAKPWVKRVLAPGSHATQLLLERAGLTQTLEELGFFNCGYGCMSCIGNSGPIAGPLHELAERMDLASVLSGNRNFDGRISPDVAQNFLAAPALVVAYALVGTVDVDLTREPVGTGADGQPVMLADILPTDDEVAETLRGVLDAGLFSDGAEGLFEGYPEWAEIATTASDTFGWDESSTYVRRPPYFDDAVAAGEFELQGARVLALLGDFVTTDHISPAGSIAPDGPAARYLRERGTTDADFNTFGSRRGNHEVMVRGTFANVKLQNLLAAGKSGGWTRDALTGEIASIYDAAEDYRRAREPLVVIAGKMYGSGSSRDWAGKGPALLGVRAVIAESFERIHRSNLVQMGVVPLQLAEGITADALGLDGNERISIARIDLSDEGFSAGSEVDVVADRGDGSQVAFVCRVRIDTLTEARYLREGGILPYVLEELLEG